MAGKVKVRKSGNPVMAAAMREIRRSSAASPHVTKKRKGSRNSKNRKAIRDYGF